MHDVAAHPPPILPSDRKTDRALFNVIGIFTFLITITVLALIGGLQISKGWGHALKQSISVQIKPAQGHDIETDISASLRALSTLPGVVSVSVISEQEAKELLKPWLGDTNLPKDLPIPRLLDVRLEHMTPANIDTVKKAIKDIDVTAEIDDHNFWLKDLNRKTLMFQAALLLNTLLILSALISAIIFATRAGLSRWKTVMTVLDDIGAAPQYTAKLYAVRFFKLSIKAGLMGALASLVFAVFMVLFWAGTNLLPDVNLTKPILFTVCLSPLIVAGLSAASAWYTVHTILINRLYP